MGWIKSTKSESLAKDAYDAIQAGRQIFVAKLNWPMMKLGFSGEVVDWSLMIEAIEQQGWVLYNFAGATDKEGRPEAFCVFRRRHG